MNSEIKCCGTCVYWDDDFTKNPTSSGKFPCTMPIIPIETMEEDYCSYYWPSNKKTMRFINDGEIEDNKIHIR